MNTPPIILSIAGSDPSGGAGVQADIKTISALGGYAAAAVTAITVQNTQGVDYVEFMSGKIVGRQVEVVIDDLHPEAVKIGMTGTVGMVSSLVEVLRRYGCQNVVLDPVMISTSGRPLIESGVVEALCRELFPLCRVVTPNLAEASLLLNNPIRTVEQMHRAASELHARYGCAFLIKGGHLEEEGMTDVLYDGAHHTFTSPRIETTNLHGTGCTLSSAIATLLAKGSTLPEAVEEAKSYVDRAIDAARGMHIGQGNGPLWHLCDIRKPDRE